MGIFKRVNDIISANFNELVDYFEEPEKMLRQAVREMEQAIRYAMDGAAKVIANENRLTKQISDLQRDAEQWKKQAERAIRGDDDELARHALIRKTECEKLAAALEDQRSLSADAALKLKRQIEAMRVRLAEARRKEVTLIARKQTVEARKKLISGTGALGVDQTAFSRFDRICDSIETFEAEAEALIELSCGPFPDEVIDFNVEAELVELKKTCANSPSE